MTEPAWRWPQGVAMPTGRQWPVEVAAGHLRLAPLRQRDADRWMAVRAANSDWTTPWDATPPPESENASKSWRAWLSGLNRSAKRGESRPWGLWWDDQLIGQVTVSGISLGSARSATIGYWISRDYAGRGLMPLAVALACDYLWSTLRLHRIEISIRPENGPSLRVVEKLGFREEGLRPAFLHIAGKWADHRVFALNREEVPGGLVNRLLAGRSLSEYGVA